MQMNNDGHHETPMEWLTLEEARQYLQVSEPTIRRMLKDGRLPGARRIGSLWRVHLPTLREQLLDEVGR